MNVKENFNTLPILYTASVSSISSKAGLYTRLAFWKTTSPYRERYVLCCGSVSG